MPDKANEMLKRILDEVVKGRRALEQQVDTVQSRVDRFRDETLSNFDGFFQRLENVESELSSISGSRQSRARTSRRGFSARAVAR